MTFALKHIRQITITRNGNPNNNNRNTHQEKNMGRKKLHGRFKRLINNISLDKTWIWLRKGNFKRETEYLLMAGQNSAMYQSYQGEDR